MKRENKTKTVQVRLTETDYNWLTKAAYSMGTNPSALVRQLVQMSINAVKASENALKSTTEQMNTKEKVMSLESEIVVNEN